MSIAEFIPLLEELMLRLVLKGLEGARPVRRWLLEARLLESVSIEVQRSVVGSVIIEKRCFEFYVEKSHDFHVL